MGAATMAALSAGVALGLWLVAAGIGGRALLPPRSAIFGTTTSLQTSLGWTAAAALAALAVLGITGWPVAAAATFAAVLAGPRFVTGGEDRARELDRTQAIASWTELIRDNMAGAAGLEQALMASAAVAPRPIEVEVRRFAARLEDMPLADALALLGDDLNHPSADLVVAALANAARMEARDLGPLLSRLAESIRGDVRMRHRVEVGRTRIRTSARIVVGVTVATMVFMYVFSRSLLDAYDTPAGQAWLAVVLAVFGLGGWLIRVYGTIEMPQRFSARRTTTTRSVR